MRVRPTLRITLMALLAALSGALGLVTPTIAGSRLLKFNGFPIVLSGFLLGPIGGFWCGALADIVAFMLKPGGAYNPLFTITSGLTGMMPVLVYQRLAPQREGKLLLDPWILLVSSLLALSIALVRRMAGRPYASINDQNRLWQTRPQSAQSIGVDQTLA